MEKFDYDIIKNPEIFRINRLDAHSDHRYYRNIESARARKADFSYSLNGSWKFSYAKNIASAVPNFYELSYDCKCWDDIRVPAHIQMEGYDVPQYANTQYPWDGQEPMEPGDIPLAFNPTASYVKYFTVPEEMAGGPVYISFQGVESGIALWLNGQFVGYSEDSFTPSEFDLTPFITDGENKLAAQVYKWTGGSWCEDQDFIRFSGIFRDVYLYTVPKVHIRDLHYKTRLDANYTDAVLQLDLLSTGKGVAKITLSDEDLEMSVDLDLSEGANHIDLPMKAPKLWSAEEPNLYDLTITVLDEKKQVMEVIAERVGFRVFEMINRVMSLNGKRIVFKGVNRHEFSSDAGRAIGEDVIRKDLITMKQNNINSVRTCHYPNNSALYRLCDELGLYVIDETNLETHGCWNIVQMKKQPIEFAVPGNRPEYLELILDRAKSMYERDKNHACILIWSCGNESFGGKDLLEMSKKFHEWDDTRYVHYEGVYWDPRYPETTDMVSSMYTPAAEIAEFLKKHRDKPYIVCEYAHAMGNSCGAIHKYLDLTEEDVLFQGGFIWDYIDQSITMHDRYGVEFQGYGGDFSDRPNDGSFSGNGICYGKDRDPSPKMQEVKFVYQNIAVTIEDQIATIYNKNLFINTDRYDAVMTLEQEGKLLDKKVMRISVDPLTKKKVKLDVSVPSAGEFVLTLAFVLKEDTLWARAGHEVAYGQEVIGHLVPRPATKQKMQVTEGYWNTGVKGEGFEILFSGLHGGLVSYKVNGRELIKRAPKPNFWRPLIENDTANLLPFRSGDWKLASMYATHKFENGRNQTDYTVEHKGDTVVVTYTYHLPTKPAKDVTLSYEVFADGEIQVTQSMDASADVGELPEFSVLFTLDADYQNLMWYGRGPEETYQDRCHAKLGVYSNKVRDNMAKYLVPQECGNKVDVRYATVTDDTGRGLYISGDALSLSVLSYTPHELDCALHPNELPPVLNTIIRVGYAQMGVGGDDTWGAQTHPEYLIDNSKPLSFTFSIRGI